MGKVLVVEDTRFLRNVIKRGIENGVGLDVVCADSLAEAARIITAQPNAFFLSLLEYTLPDAPNGEVIDHVVGMGIPAVAFANHFSEGMTEEVFAKNVIDYVITDCPANLDYLLSVVSRISNNRKLKILLVEDSATARHYCCMLLRQYQFMVLEAADGVEAIAMIDATPDLSLVITDYHMPNMDGFELVKQIRQRYARHELPVIGISAQGNTTLSAKFIKNGANDFLTKPFSREEFFCRISQNVEFIEHVRALKDGANRDYLTGLHNRRYLFAHGTRMHAEHDAKGRPLAVAMIDIDFFKRVNDTHGHDAGDAVLRQVAAALAEQMEPSGVLARVGGEEFCLLVADVPPADIPELFEHIRSAVEVKAVVAGSQIIHVTVSIGVCTALDRSLEEMIAKADTMLYLAKKGGRNRVVIQS